MARIRADGDTALYDTTLAAVSAAVAAARPNTVAYQRRQERGPGSPDLETTLARLVDGADPARPVEVHTIALGTATPVRCETLAGATKGKAYTASRPEDLESVFLAALTG